MNVRYSDLPDDLSSAEHLTLIEVYTRLNNECADIKAQIAEAKSKVWTDGEYSDPQWFRKVNDALRIKQRVVRQLQVEFKRRKDEARKGGGERPTFRVDALDLDGLSREILEENLNTSAGWFVSCVTTSSQVLLVWRLSKAEMETS